jgi:hypothetical protein
MRSRFSVALVVALLLSLCLAAAMPASAASVRTMGVVQPEDSGDEGGADESGGADSGEGQDDPDAESGASEEESEGTAAETGPPWTYQMARISLIGLVALLLACAYMYWRLVVRRARGES